MNRDREGERERERDREREYRNVQNGITYVQQLWEFMNHVELLSVSVLLMCANVQKNITYMS